MGGASSDPSHCLRPPVFQVALVIAAALVAAATGYCASSTKGSVTTTVCDSGQTTFSINHWADGTSYDELRGQFFVFVSALFCLLVSFGLFFLSFASYDTDRRAVSPCFWSLHQQSMSDFHFQIFITCGMGAALMLISGIVESWFAAGFGKMSDNVSFYIRSWVAGAVSFATLTLTPGFNAAVFRSLASSLCSYT